MRFDTSQQMRTSQHMKLAPKMIQSMEILQMPLMALQERIEQELESNIALEQVEVDPDSERDDDAYETDADPDQRERELSAGDDARDFARLNEFENSYGEAADNAFSERSYVSTRTAGERDGKMDAMANTAARGESLTEQLSHQIAFLDVTESVAKAAEVLLDFIDEDGFLSADLESIIEQRGSAPGTELTTDLLEEALVEIQMHMEPAGIGARDQKECLLLQVDRYAADFEDEHDWSDVVMLISKYYDDLLQNRLPKIEKESGMSIERIRAAIGLMKLLDLHPARELVETGVPPIIPDVIVEYEESTDTYIARLCDGVVPLLRISTEAEQLATDKTLDKETREFAQNGIRNASWLIDAIAQRTNTLLRVVNVVLNRQREYFDYGPQHLKPLPMIEVADQLGVHVATVSRAVADKWLQTPRGMVPLRSFFSGGATTDAGEEMAWDAIKAKLKEIVDAEDKARPLSDEALSKALKEQGIDIARRTVVKYRQQLGIPAARLRKAH